MAKIGGTKLSKASEASAASNVDVATLLTQLARGDVDVAALLAQLAKAGVQAPQASKRGRPAKRGETGPFADDYEVKPGFKPQYVNIYFTLNGESCKPPKNIRDELNLNGFRFVKGENDGSGPHYWGFAKMLPDQFKG